MSDFRRELAAVLNKYGAEGGSNTPDFILAEYVQKCLAAFDDAVGHRADWYGRMDEPGAVSETARSIRLSDDEIGPVICG